MTQRRALGDYAELLVFEYLKAIKKTKMSEDVYDQEKDMVFNGYNLEVKARTAIFKKPFENTYAVDQSQWRKIDNCPIVMFVHVPMKREERTSILFLKNKKAFTLGKLTKKSELNRFYHIDRMQHIYTYEDEKVNQIMYNLNPSKYKE